MLGARRHRAAAKPTPVTKTNRITTMVSATQLTPVTGHHPRGAALWISR